MGTLFLDEITEMPLDLQANLLRALESQTIMRVGGNAPIQVNCRVISATNRSDAELAERNILREDLYYRLAVYPIYVSPLRERKEDIQILAEYFLKQLNEQHQTELEIDADGISKLEAYDWPGNIRELKHAIHRAYIRTESGSIILQVPTKLASPFANKPDDVDASGLRPGRRLDEVERDLINLTLERFNGDKVKSAKVLGISVKTLYNRLNAYNAEDNRSSA